ncbi:hypothetical protein [Actinomadura sp. NPDC049753]|uniref:hypothetical protein n=1 Tax=Actinomadura sp. NPDC049753 TaxID=3154739 RepID=UPI003439D7E0
MPFQNDDITIGLACGRDDDGRPRGWYSVQVRAEALRRLGLHPGQPTSRAAAPSPPAWWHAAAERAARWR